MRADLAACVGDETAQVKATKARLRPAASFPDLADGLEVTQVEAKGRARRQLILQALGRKDAPVMPLSLDGDLGSKAGSTTPVREFTAAAKAAMNRLPG